MSTSTLLPTVIADQINHLIDQLVELQIKFQEDEITVYQYNKQCEELHEQLVLLRQQQAEW